jgi:hypothetical protein
MFRELIATLVAVVFEVQVEMILLTRLSAFHDHEMNAS